MSAMRGNCPTRIVSTCDQQTDTTNESDAYDGDDSGVDWEDDCD
eukprot:CAMPEP_0194406420 /NCGR_PEP_ID=MMETSP0176-20130528/4637_1 /TAXON_ID=216777 /ORGANISM="Proboscia alata, Strain PI-D3" /LENGTH=43 /DNA_ID= /DNA_START= /DNA_END= /DNA_ORIENTATION=